jgi:hypothetical protein
MTPHAEIPDLVALLIVTTPSIVAAVSSLLNGKKLREGANNAKGNQSGSGAQPKKPPKKNGERPDWYHPPNFD